MTLYRFGDYRIDVAAGRVDRRGEPVPLQPLPFALLVHLIRERRRVVPKDELLRRFWRADAASNTVLVRAVMKLRQALPGPDGSEVVRTVGRVGYRFVAPLAPRSPSPRDATPAVRTIALLPLENATGDASLAWLGLGLMALAARDLERQPSSLSVAAVPSVMTALDGARTAGDTSIDAAVRRATGAHVVVHGRVVRGRGAELRLVYEMRGDASHKGAVACERPTDLAARFADAVVQAFHPSALPPPRVPHDPLADEAFARGLDALTAHHWSRAANLLRMAVDLEPQRIDAQLELLRAIGNLGDAELLAPAQRLLAQATQAQDSMLAARVHQALGRFHLNRSELALADHHLGLSLECAAGQGGPDWTARTLMLQAGAAAERLDYARARRIVGRMAEQCERSGDRILPVAGLIFEANATAAEGDLEQAVVLLLEATRRARDVRATSFLNAACDSAAWNLAKLGRLAEAAAHAEESVAVALADGTAANAWRSLPALCWIHRLMGTPVAARRTIERMPDPAGLPCPADAWRARALLAAAEGRHGDAADDLVRAMHRYRELQHVYDEEQTLPWLVDALVLSGRLDEAEAELAAATAPHLGGSADLRVQVLHGRALLAHARGRVDEARACLADVADRAAAPLWRAWACIDLAWLEAGAGRLDAASRTLARVPAVFADHPLVQAVRDHLRTPQADRLAGKVLPTRR